MSRNDRTALARARRFFRKEDGAATIEAMLWLTVFFGLFGLLADVSMIFNGQARILHIVQDANRNMSIGRYSTTSATEDAIRARMQGISSSAEVTTTYLPGTGLISSRVTVPVTDLDLFGIGGFFKSYQMTVQAETLLEA